MATTTAQTVPMLTPDDRCDRCGAQAYVQVDLVKGGGLLFCVHHYVAHAAKLSPLAKQIHDESHRLTDV
ncbi:MAG: hypothetical protein KDC39_05850 [Actinobacteria bacterium]|nr:hypothetical protein [Actinomycetota bacterium]